MTGTGVALESDPGPLQFMTQALLIYQLEKARPGVPVRQTAIRRTVSPR